MQSQAVPGQANGTRMVVHNEYPVYLLPPLVEYSDRETNAPNHCDTIKEWPRHAGSSHTN